MLKRHTSHANRWLGTLWSHRLPYIEILDSEDIHRQAQIPHSKNSYSWHELMAHGHELRDRVYLFCIVRIQSKIVYH